MFLQQVRAEGAEVVLRREDAARVAHARMRRVGGVSAELRLDAVAGQVVVAEHLPVNPAGQQER